jgi:hypothetical protein
MCKRPRPGRGRDPKILIDRDLEIFIVLISLDFLLF